MLNRICAGNLNNSQFDKFKSMELKLAFIGFGNVARSFARLLNERKAQLASDYDIRWRATAIATATRGRLLASAGIDLEEAAAAIERGDSLTLLPGASRADDSMSVVESCDADILFETSPLNPTDGEPAISYIRRALGRKIHAVTANKGPIAFAYRELKALAAQSGAQFRFEGAVMDGAPVFNLVEYCLPAARITGFYGLLNSTTNIILTGMQSGASFDDALDEARKMGIAEANSDYDVDGWDAAVKAVAIANVLMGADARPGDVDRRGIRQVTAGDLNSAARAGCSVRLIARGERSESGVKLTVAPELVKLSSTFGGLSGSTNALTLKTDLMGEISIIETDPGVEQTAYALLSDMIRIHEESSH
jgi:homoserine dehydrogenase